jgi:BspA type Leucine rich repeat region (6 copies)
LPFTFEGCGVTNVTMPVGVVNIREGAFAGCGLMTSVTIPSGVTNIGYGAFHVCTGLTAVAIPEGVVAIGDLAFYGCAGLGVVTVPDSVTRIGLDAFKNCAGLKEVTIGSTIIGIGKGAFLGCGSITRVTLSGLPEVVYGAASYSLKEVFDSSGFEVVIGPGVTNIKAFAFEGCRVTNVTFPAGVTNIGNGAFVRCDLTNITIPASVTNIGLWAFYECNGLTGVYCKGNAPNVSESTFYGATNSTIYYLSGTLYWEPTLGGRPTVLWDPKVQIGEGGLGVLDNAFGFTINGGTNVVLVVEACTNLGANVWFPVSTNRLINGTSSFSDSDWTNSPARFYRFRMP